MSICKSKLAVIHVAKSKLNLNNDEYQDLLWGVAQVESSKELDDKGFNLVMKRFTDLGFKSTYKKSQFGNRQGMASPRQVQYIRQLWSQYTGEYNETSLNHWIENHFGITSLRFVNSSIVSKVIHGLKTMTQRQRHLSN